MNIYIAKVGYLNEIKVKNVYGSDYLCRPPDNPALNINTMEYFLEILKYTIPALIVFATAYYLLKLYLDDRLRYEKTLQRSESLKTTLPLRLQAYERFTLLCDRCSIPNLLLRVRVPGMTMGDLRGTLMLNINQEFAHNTSQQLYVSETLWQIITLAKNETLAYISQTSEAFLVEGSSDEFVTRLLQGIDEMPATPLQRAIVAIRTEAGQLF